MGRSWLRSRSSLRDLWVKLGGLGHCPGWLRGGGRSELGGLGHKPLSNWGGPGGGGLSLGLWGELLRLGGKLLRLGGKLLRLNKLLLRLLLTKCLS